MSEPSTAGEAEDSRSAGDPPLGSPAGEARGPAAIVRERSRAAGRALERFAARVGSGLLALGLLAGLSRCLGWAIERSAMPDSRLKVIVDALFLILAYGLAGLAAVLFCRVLAAWIIESIDRDRAASDDLMTQAARAVEALGRIVELLEQGAGRPPAPTPADHGRERSLAEIDRADRSADWAQAEVLLDDFAVRFPDDPTLPRLREQHAARRSRAVQEQMAQLEAARQVHDAARVLELYQAVGPSLEGPPRGALERDLARWFLNLIHRRLRTSRIQAEVVVLATQVAETFGATVEGASMRAALPTLRRSVGLCPRCAQPYTGAADACPQCLAGGPKVAHRTLSDPPSLPSQEGRREGPSQDAMPEGRSD